jgi:hypothetical protein
MTKRSVRVLIASAVVAAAVIYVGVRRSAPYARWIGFNVKTELQNHRDFVVSGVVVDDDGEPLDGVTVSVNKGRRKKAGFETEYAQRYQKVSRTFEFRETGAAMLLLEFLKPGYEPARFETQEGGEHAGMRIVLHKKRGT